MLVQMELSRILIHERKPEQLIELRELDPNLDSPRSFPIVIGIVEAAAIGRRLEGINAPPQNRPMTHDLLGTIITGMGGTLEAITITDLIDGAFIAQLSIARPDGHLTHIDARPSDAIALGIATNTPIFADEKVIQQACITTPPNDQSNDDFNNPSPPHNRH
ncbi:MAG: bifunctional nuclease family protein [Phycisphaerales bacterium]|nr:bifunctional nuclease family protein [Phycisphaerales bacterium]